MNPLVATGVARDTRTALSVNVNKVALLRNTRHLGIPSVVRAAAHRAARPARTASRCTRGPTSATSAPHDVHELAALLQDWPQAEFNIEGNPFHNLMEFVRELRPHQCTFVPDSDEPVTRDHGWDLPRRRRRACGR